MAFNNKIPADKVEHSLKQYTLNKARVFPFDEIDGKKYPYFTKELKKYYFTHPNRAEFSLTDEQVTQLYSDSTGKFNPLKSAIFEVAKATPPAKDKKEEK